MRVVAIEEHFTSSTIPNPELLRTMGEHPLLLDVRPRLEDIGAGRIAAMDAAGIDLQVLSHVIPGPESLAPAESVPAARHANDLLAKAVADRPDRFAGFATLPMPDPPAAAAELDRTVRELGFVGAMINGTVGGRFYDDPAFLPVFEKAEELGVPLYLHPSLPTPDVVRAYYSGLPTLAGACLATAVWGWHAETAVHILRLIVAGVFDRFERLQLITGHLGQMLPFALARIDTLLTPACDHLRQPVAEYFQTNLHLTTSGYTTFPPLQCAMSVVGVDRIIFSVDYPFAPNEPACALLADAPISAEDREKIAHGNVERLLRIG